MTDSATHHCYLFEAKSIQGYIVDTGRLKELIGGSELIDSLCPDLVDNLLEEMALEKGKDILFSRNAGGAFYAFSEDNDKLSRFATAWTLLVRQYAPGLELAQARASGSSYHAAFKAASADLLASRNRAVAALPQPGPCTLLAPRSGRPAVPGSRAVKDDRVDQQTRVKLLREQGAKVKLGEKFLRDLKMENWPNSLNPDTEASRGERPFPFKGEKRQIAVVHADGNGLGQLLLGMGVAAEKTPDKFIELFQSFSSAVTTATEEAAQAASEEVLAPQQDALVPARPIVLGGDDLTIIVRADLALGFTRAFLHHFEERTAAQLKALSKQQPELKTLLPEKLTACAGIAYTHASYPFLLGMQLAEELCRYSKATAKSNNDEITPSALTFHRVTSAQSGSWEDILDRELSLASTEDTETTHYHYTLGTYALDRDTHMPALDDLLTLTALLSREELSHGPTRQLLTLLDKERADAEQRYKRWRERMPKPLLAGYNTCLESLSGAGGIHPDLPYLQRGENAYATPLGDVITLKAIDDATATTNNAKKEVA